MSFKILALITLISSIAGGPAILQLEADLVPASILAASAQAAPDVPNPKFLPVAGATLDARRSSAVERGRADSSASHFWVAYGFNVRPGIAVDYDFGGSKDCSQSYEGFSISNNSKVETRNLAVFLLYERNTQKPDRVEVYNLDRKRGYDGYPVYWIGRASNDESFGLLQGLLQSQPSGWVAERSVVAIAIHDDPRAGDLLEGIVRDSRVERARTSAVTWLGIVADRLTFLADLARDTGESSEIRKQAAIAIGLSRSASAVATLKGLYESVSDRQVREQTIVAVGIHGQSDDAARPSDDEAVDFLIHIADTETDRELRRQAIFWLSQKAGSRSLDAIVGHANGVANDDDVEVQKQAVFALSQRPKNEAVPNLIKIAKTHPNPEVRKMSIFWLGQIDDERVMPFFKELLAH